MTAYSSQPTSPTPREKPPANRLIGESSPYLRQHAHNPVEWYPWGPEALDRAEQENKPIFLSIGYSACHWCHVMERESFEDRETAEILNRHFISVKVDRQQRPDLDEIYMTAVQMMTARGGWPLSVFLTPQRKPFFGGTYFPPRDIHGMPAFKTVLTHLADAWQQRGEAVQQHAEELVAALQAHAAPQPPTAALPDISLLSRATAELKRQFDPEWGGFGGPPKFPPSGAIALLFRQYAHTDDDQLLAMASCTLDRMACGGIHDQLGGGFHRYAVDRHWAIPHFEKMLYDNALLCRAYLEAWQITRQPSYRTTARRILDYVLREMTDSDGGFYAAEDADSQAQEGTFYLWRPEEIRATLRPQEATLFCRYYGVTEEGNFEGRNVLSAPRDPAPLLEEFSLSAEQLEQRLEQSRERLLAVRGQRVRPGKDDKILAAWNGMTISAFAQGYQVLGQVPYLQAAQRAADFVLRRMFRGETLLRMPDAGEGGFLDDYAELAAGLIDLYQSDFRLRWLEAADRLAERMIAQFWDAKNGGFFYTAAGRPDLLVRTKPLYDADVPSGNATAAVVLLQLSLLLDNTDYRERAELILRSADEVMRSQPQAAVNLLCALHLCLLPTTQIAIAGDPQADDTRQLLAVIYRRFLPRKVLAVAEPGTGGFAALAKKIPWLADKTMLKGKATAYVCENFACRQPVDDPGQLAQILDQLPSHLKGGPPP